MNTLIETTDAARALIGKVLHQGADIAADYPLVFGEGSPGRVITLEEDGELRAACTVLVREFVVDGVRIKGGMIGSVVTDPDHQGRGLGTKLLLQAEIALQLEGCAFTLLWASQPDWYLKRGYAPMGSENDFLITPGARGGLPKATDVRVFTPEDAGAVHAIYEAHGARVARTADETTTLLGCPGMRTVVREREGRVVAYACYGRGADLQNSIHEWGGDVEDVLALVRALLDHHCDVADPDQPVFLIAPPQAVDLSYCLLTLGVASQRGMLGLGKVLDRRTAAATLAARLPEGGHAEVITTPLGEQVYLSGPKDEGELADDAVLALLFAATEIRQDVAQFLERFGLENAQLPLEPFVWGLDSI